jgi:hypothetical protein
VRLDLAGGAWSAIPEEFKEHFEAFFSLQAAWIGAVGFDADGPIDAIQDALAALALASTPAGPVVALVEGLKLFADFIGAEVADDPEVVTLTVGAIHTVVQALQSLLFPALSGEDWMSGTVQVVVENGVPSAHIVGWDNAAIKYGFQTESRPVEGAPWWAGSEGAFFLAAETRIRDDQLGATAAIDADGALTLTVSASVPVPFDWVTVGLQVIARAEQAIVDLFADSGHAALLARAAEALGVPDARAYLLALLNGVSAWVREHVLERMREFFAPNLDFHLEILIEEGPASGWLVTVTAAHDNFPRHVLSLTSAATGDRKELYSEPRLLEQSAKGPLELCTWATPAQGLTKHTVPAEWITDWR